MCTRARRGPRSPVGGSASRARVHARNGIGLRWESPKGRAGARGGRRRPRWLVAMALACAVVSSLPGAGAGELRIAYNSHWAPFSHGEGGQVRGLLPEVLDAIIADRMHVSVSHHGFPWKRVQKYVQEGRMDAFCTFASPERLQYTQTSRYAVYRLDVRAFVRSGSSSAQALRADPRVGEIGRHRVCIMLGDGWSRNFYTKHGIAYQYGTDTANCLRQLDHDRADVFMHVTESVLYQIEKAGLERRIEMLPHVYDSVPLTLMVSKRSSYQGDFMERFDIELERMQHDGSYQALVDGLRGPAYRDAAR